LQSRSLDRNSYSKFITVLITQTLTLSLIPKMVKNLYVVMIKIDETLPWIELKGEYQTRREAKKRTEEFLSSIKTKIIEISEKRKRMKSLVYVKTAR
jgi:hypothetical protein